MNMKSRGLLAMFLLLAAVSTELKPTDGQKICNMSGQELMSCKPAVTPPNPANPSAACCVALTHADINCLCSFKNSNMLSSLGIDPNLAIQLPQKCKLPSPNC